MALSPFKVVLALLLSSLPLVFLGPIAASTQAISPQGGASAVASLTCPSGDLIYSEHVDMPAEPQVVGAPTTPEAALGDFLADDEPWLSTSDFDRAAVSDEAVQFDVQHGPGAVATALVEQYGDGWTTRSFSACNSYLLSEKGHVQP